MLVDYKSRHGILKVESAHLHISNHPDGPGRNGIFEMGLTNWPHTSFWKENLTGKQGGHSLHCGEGLFPI